MLIEKSGQLPRLSLKCKRHFIFQHRLNHIQCAFMIIIIGSVTGDLFNVFCGIVHRKGITRHFKHLCVIAAVANGDDILWRQIPAFQ